MCLASTVVGSVLSLLLLLLLQWLRCCVPHTHDSHALLEVALLGI